LFIGTTASSSVLPKKKFFNLKYIFKGDREAHQASLNFGQIGFFSGFSLFFTIFDGFTLHLIFPFFQSLRKNWIKMILTAVTLYNLILNYSPEHIYNIADNRHYVFYVKKYFYERRGDVVKLLYIPLYLFSLWNMKTQVETFLKQQNGETQIESGKKILWNFPLWSLFFVVSVSAVLIPAKLLEFRYFIVPFLLWKMHTKIQRNFMWALAEFGYYTMINIVTLYVFLYRPFVHPDYPTEQRFMW
jgi:alpha-1,2-glucosyltransferase